MPRKILTRVFALVCLLTASPPLAFPETKSSKPLTWPSLPDQPRFQYEYTLRTFGDVVTKKKEENPLRKLLAGEQDKSADLVLDKPGAIAARKGVVYVTDTMKNLIVVFDLPRRRIYPFGVRDDQGKLIKPVALAIDQEGLVYVADVGSRNIKVFDSLGLYLHTIGSQDDLERPTGVAVNPSGKRICVVDRSTPEKNMPQVICYDKQGKKLLSFGGPGTDPGKFNIPLVAAMGPDDQIYILDSGNFRVQVFDKKGKYISSVGQLGAVPGTFARPRGLALDQDGLIYVSDAAFGNIQIFNPQGELLLVIGEQTTDSGDKPGRYSLISGLAVDDTGYLFVVDQLSRKVEIIRRLSENEGKKYLEILKP